MVRAIERIEKDINSLKEEGLAIAEKLTTAYTSYLGNLGQVLQKQLILGSYYICTQGYAEEFLNLSLNQRENLQQSIRKLGQKASENLMKYIEPPEIKQTDIIDEKTEKPAHLLDFSNPLNIIKGERQVEKGIQETLKKLSQETNILLQKSGVLPKKLPEPVLAAATLAASESSNDMMPSPPNIVNLVIQVSNKEDEDDQEEESNLTQIIAIHLRLGEIEFADNMLSSQRKEIRNIVSQLHQLGRSYQKMQRELKIAMAEAAWRSSWHED
ncbi:hypothetical protein H6F32_08065 [Anabaena sp. FACHB-1237]|uniref:hypothetical protein n=1 Tax=Anabaena sp. FACHB-1237 TaxID=2692769 RepID=UPI001680A773|nr:hypothetical protein [Anabaena sp. FACHB-1237]MBD2137539.1 hypothetical protein [Anabaena sp. FACHB-1237]